MDPKLSFGLASSPTSTDGTKRNYLVQGLKLLARAQREAPLAADSVEALSALFEDDKKSYRPSTTRLYQRQVDAVLSSQMDRGELT